MVGVVEGCRRGSGAEALHADVTLAPTIVRAEDDVAIDPVTRTPGAPDGPQSIAFHASRPQRW